MDDNSRDRLTLARRFLEPANSTHRQYEALRAFFVEGVPSAEVATRFGYTPGSFRVLVHEFRNRPERDFFIRVAGVGRPPGKQNRLRARTDYRLAEAEPLRPRHQPLGIARDGESLSPAAIAAILKAEGFAKLPRRFDDERPDHFRPMVAEMADIRELDLAPPAISHCASSAACSCSSTWLKSAGLDGQKLLARAGFPGSKMVPARVHCVRSAFGSG